MLTLNDADEFFAAHLLHETIAVFPDAKRMAAVQTAARDIAAACGFSELPETLPEHIRNAVFEQAAYLLLNPQVFTGNGDEAAENVISPRARAMLVPENPEFPRCTLRRG